MFKTSIVWPSSISWVLLMIGIGLCGFGTQLFLTMGFQRETASRASLGTYTQIIFAEILDRIAFHSELSVLSLIGTGVILTSAIYVAVSNFHHVSMIHHELMTVVQLMKHGQAPKEAPGYSRIRSMDKRQTERSRLCADHTTHEEPRGLVSDDYSERSTLDLEDPRRSMEDV